MIETPRLVIRPILDEERTTVVAAWLDPANERAPGQPEERVRFWAANVPWGIYERETGELVGDCSLFHAEEHDAWELAYGVNRARWGRGYATEAARACVAYGFEELGLERIVADVDPANAASVRVLEKCGFRAVTPELYTLARPK